MRARTLMTVRVHSSTWKEHLIHLENVLIAFLDVGMTLRLKKCKFGCSKVQFIGHIVGSGQRSVDLDKVLAIKAIPEPHTKKLLRSFLGMCNFYRAYISQYSSIAYQLTELTKNVQHKLIKFNDEQRAAFQKLKQHLCDSVTLYAPDTGLPYIVKTDSSDYAVVATLSREDGKV